MADNIMGTQEYLSEYPSWESKFLDDDDIIVHELKLENFHLTMVSGFAHDL
jgi:hypothetical protein